MTADPTACPAVDLPLAAGVDWCTACPTVIMPVAGTAGRRSRRPSPPARSPRDTPVSRRSRWHSPGRPPCQLRTAHSTSSPAVRAAARIDRGQRRRRRPTAAAAPSREAAAAAARAGSGGRRTAAAGGPAAGAGAGRPGRTCRRKPRACPRPGGRRRHVRQPQGRSPDDRRHVQRSRQREQPHRPGRDEPHRVEVVLAAPQPPVQAGGHRAPGVPGLEHARSPRPPRRASPTSTTAVTGSYVVRSAPCTTTTTPRPATSPAYDTRPAPAARTGAPGAAGRSAPRWPAA